MIYTQLNSNFSNSPELSDRLHPAAACAARVPAQVQQNRGDCISVRSALP